jgi:hypothetical protein
MGKTALAVAREPVVVAETLAQLGNRKPQLFLLGCQTEVDGRYSRFFCALSAARRKRDPDFTSA